MTVTTARSSARRSGDVRSVGRERLLQDAPAMSGTPAVDVRSALASDSCGIGVPLAQEWVIFARRRGDDTFWSRDVAPDELVSTFCDGNRPFGPDGRSAGSASRRSSPWRRRRPRPRRIRAPQPSPAASSATSGEEDDDNTVVPIGLVAATAAAVTAVVVLRRARSRHEPA
ncbi:MAG: hypothetical protein WKF58_05075 [Ilumatobacteraceae bacterium]